MKKLKRNKTILGYHTSTISLFKTGKRSVSWPLAEKLAGLFPGKSIVDWKNASPEDLKRAFQQLEIETKTEKETEKKGKR